MLHAQKLCFSRVVFKIFIACNLDFLELFGDPHVVHPPRPLVGSGARAGRDVTINGVIAVGVVLVGRLVRLTLCDCERKYEISTTFVIYCHLYV